jgi:hypothetical protein
MKNLLKLQQDFAAHIFQKSDKKIIDTTSYSGLEALERLNIYRNNVLGNFESVLSSIFLVTAKILGTKKFTQLMKKYCKDFPSKSGDLNEFGKEFPKFLTNYKPLYLKDLTQLELFYHQSYFAAKSAKEFDLKSFKKLSEEDFSNLTFSLNYSCFLFASNFSVFSIWKKEKEIKNFANPEFTMIYANEIFLLNEEEFLFLSLIQKEKKLFEIYKLICKKTKKDCDIGKLINHFISNGIIADYA